MKPTPAELLPIYRANLAAYMREGDKGKVDVQRRLIKRLEEEAK